MTLVHENYIEILVVENPEAHVGKKAILHEPHASLFVTIVRATPHSAVVRHADGSLQKAVWGRLSVEIPVPK